MPPCNRSARAIWVQQAWHKKHAPCRDTHQARAACKTHLCISASSSPLKVNVPPASSASHLPQLLPTAATTSIPTAALRSAAPRHSRLDGEGLPLLHHPLGLVVCVMRDVGRTVEQVADAVAAVRLYHAEPARGVRMSRGWGGDVPLPTSPSRTPDKLDAPAWGRNAGTAQHRLQWA